MSTCRTEATRHSALGDARAQLEGAASHRSMASAQHPLRDAVPSVRI